MSHKLLLNFLCAIVSLAAAGAHLCMAENVGPERTTAVAGSHDKLVPGQEIEYEGKLSPDWKANWDVARSLYREKKYAEALVQYEILFTQKENIEEARWEYVSILMYLERWENAKAVLEKLLATDPESVRYQIAMAQVNRANGDSDKAIDLYLQLRKEQIQERDLVLVLEGLVEAYEMEGRKNETADHLEQLARLKPGDRNLQIRLVALQLELGNMERAEELSRMLEQSMPENAAVLALRAQVEDTLKRDEAAAVYWQKVVALEPDNPEANSRLYAYYFAAGNWEMSFNHLKQLIKTTPNDVSLLWRAADLNMRLDRIDRALEYYEYCLMVEPLNRKIAEQKKNAQKLLAADLLALVENEDGLKLWRDLNRITPDSVGVYREIAGLLREQGKIDKLIEVLLVLNRQVPEDMQIYEELATLLEQHGYAEELEALKAGGSLTAEPAGN